MPKAKQFLTMICKDLRSHVFPTSPPSPQLLPSLTFVFSVSPVLGIPKTTPKGFTELRKADPLLFTIHCSERTQVKIRKAGAQMGQRPEAARPTFPGTLSQWSHMDST